MKNNRIVIILFAIIVLVNTISVFADKDLFNDFKDLNLKRAEMLSTIDIYQVFSNSFFFITEKPIKKIDTSYTYRLDNKNTGELIYFKVKTVKFKDSLFFFQHIDWLTKKNRKIEEGNYSLNKILSDD
ncbi:hypothetical protein [Winogradskyella alexanderae]|uniref:Uncharacterized protein n=1 Tax=Winogradskyella alexanderae TaxID=2877123 RepID=A0ABS7XMR2_9FLAO|nr:hypothetical protein [Winogradskyella alexanderae]MCA0131297.1 hypothetical protein [Winogradskyella alexanderae]